MNWLRRFKIIDTWKNVVIPKNDRKYYFKLSPKEYEDAQKIYKEKGTISYEFSPTGIGSVVKVKVLKTGEIIDITDYDTW